MPGLPPRDGPWSPAVGPGHSPHTPVLPPISRKQPLSSYLVLLGSISSYPQAGDPQELHAVAQVITHPEYWEENNRADIALVRLASPVTFSGHILPVCLPKPGDPLGHGTWCWVTGWGNVATSLRKDTQRVWQGVGATSADGASLGPAAPATTLPRDEHGARTRQTAAAEVLPRP